jgi:hypothetical protein
MNKTEGQFVSHCDGSEGYSCDLGYFEYTCPACGRDCQDFDEVWWNKDDIYLGREVKFNCERCDKPLKIYYDKEEGEIYVLD